MPQSTLALDLPVAPVRRIADAAEAAAFVQAIFDREMVVTPNNAKAGSKRDDAMRELPAEQPAGRTTPDRPSMRR